MFGKKRIEALEKRIEALENNDTCTIEISTCGSDNTGIIRGIGGVEKLRHMFLSPNTNYRVSCGYILNKIIDHLKMEIIIESGTDDSLRLNKIKKVANKI